MDPIQHITKQLPHIEELLGYTFRTRELPIRAFTHSSFTNEHRELALPNNERLEFFGDAVINLIITEYLYQHLPSTPEGELSSLRSALISKDACKRYIDQLPIADFLLVGKGERLNRDMGRHTLNANLFEAIVGAICEDGGFDAAKVFFVRHFAHILEEQMVKPNANWKALLQEHLQQKRHTTPQYRLEQATGPDHLKQFAVGVYVNDTLIATGRGSSKKAAEQAAAQEALYLFDPSRRPA